MAEIHEVSALAVVAHQRCLRNPVDDGPHNLDVAKVTQALKAALGFEGPVYALVATYRRHADWGLREISRS